MAPWESSAFYAPLPETTRATPLDLWRRPALAPARRRKRDCFLSPTLSVLVSQLSPNYLPRRSVESKCRRFPGHEIVERIARSAQCECEDSRIIKITESRERVGNDVERIYQIHDGSNDDDKRVFGNLAISPIRVGSNQTQHCLEIWPGIAERSARH